MNSWKSQLVILLALGLVACGGSGGGGGTEDDGPVEVPDPTAATLVFPDNNTECNEGEVLNESQSRVTFRWNASQNTDSYTVTVRNLNTLSQSSVNASTNEATITISRGTPYEWFVVSRANGTTATATSATWRFFNEGPGVENYAPFPAVAVNPTRGANLSGMSSVDLEWTASDLDNDIVEYEVFFDSTSDPTTSLGTTTDTTVAGVAVSAGTIYYWKVVTRDSEQNSSTSEIFQFRVD